MKASTHLPNAPFVRVEPKRLGLAVALAAHAAVLLVLLLGHYQSSPKLVPILVEIIAQPGGLDGHLLAPQPKVASRFIKSKGKPRLSKYQSRKEQPLVVAKLTRTPNEARHFDEASYSNESPASAPLTSDQEMEAQPEPSSSIFSTMPVSRGGITGLVEQQQPQPAGLTVTRRTDWEDNPVEDKELTYSAPGGAVRLTLREASSAGLFGTNFSPRFNTNADKTSEPFGLASTERPTNTMAKSQKVEWTVVDWKNFGVTVFGYKNVVGSGFKPFEETKKEFETPGTETTKAGGEVRAGAFSFGFAHSRIANSVDSSANFFTSPDANANFFATQNSNTNFTAAKNEASVTLALPKLLPGMQASISSLLPNLWASVSNEQTLPSSLGTAAAASGTVSTSFGGTWNWNNGYATVGYWDYSSGKTPGLDATWSGRGFDANLGTHRSSFGIDVGLSYGQSEDAAISSQSGGALYYSYVTVSYSPDKLPAVSLTASAGNFNYNAIADGVALSNLYPNLYTDSSHDAYSSLAVGLDLTNWLRTNQTIVGPDSSVKLLYRYSKNDYFDNYASTVKGTDNLLAMMVQGKF